VALQLAPALAYFLFIVLSTLRLDPALSLFTGAFAALEYFAVSLWLLRGEPAPPEMLAAWQTYFGKAAMIAGCGVGAAFVSRQLRVGFGRAVASVEEQRRALEVFGQHVSPAVAERLLANQTAIGTEVRRVCVMFLDIRGFTAFAEKKRPEEVVAYLNALFAFMIETVDRHGGIVNKFLGDGFMAIFGAPLSTGDDCASAVRASLEILATVKEHAADGRIAPTLIGIGLHAGDVVVGNVGSPLRKEYTVIGDVVNLASRIEGLNKPLGSQVLLSGDVFEAAGEIAASAVRAEPMQVKGRVEPVDVYRLA
jgi:adenylate cyclase